MTTTAVSFHPHRPSPSPLYSSSFAQASLKKKTMSITQTYYLAHKARAKLSTEAARSDHNLRLLVGHANLLDSLMLELADAEREQESWFNQSVRGATRSTSEDRHVQWADSIIEEPEEDWQAEDVDSSSDSDDDYEENDVEMADVIALHRTASNTKVVSVRIPAEYDDDMEEDDLEEDYAQLELVRTPSHSSPPELDHDSESSDDESMPPSPPQAMLTFPESNVKEEEMQSQDSFYSEGFYLPPRNPSRLVSAISVY